MPSQRTEEISLRIEFAAQFCQRDVHLLRCKHWRSTDALARLWRSGAWV